MESYKQNGFQSPNNSYNYNYNHYNYNSNYSSQCYNANQSYNYGYYPNYSFNNDSGCDNSYLTTSPSPSAQTSAYQQNASISPISTVPSYASSISQKRSVSEASSEQPDETDVPVQSAKNKRPKIAKLENLNNKNMTYRCVECYRDFNSAARYLMHQHKFHFKRSSTECPICCKFQILV
jgi:hypothetical protein